MEGGFLLDHGFQVLLTEYKEVRKYLDKQELQLQYFTPGARIYFPGRIIEAVDPLRERKDFWKAVSSPIGTMRDKWLLFRLVLSVRSKKPDEIFGEKSMSTLEFLQNRGFTKVMIDRFFRPFFGGIFLEDKLETSSRMFLFVLKMFSQGHAALPSFGMETIPKILLRKLKKTKIHYKSPVLKIEKDKVLLKTGQIVNFKNLIVAAFPEQIIPGYTGRQYQYVGTGNFYFRSPESPIGEPIIGLVPDRKKLVNNFCVLSDVCEQYSETGEALISVTINKYVKGLDVEDYVKIVKEEMTELLGPSVEKWTFIKHFNIRKALPVHEDLRYDLRPEETQYSDHIYLAGDHLLNPSLDAAMRSGRRAAEAVIASYH
jgi:hypothetical protein